MPRSEGGSWHGSGRFEASESISMPSYGFVVFLADEEEACWEWSSSFVSTLPLNVTCSSSEECFSLLTSSCFGDLAGWVVGAGEGDAGEHGDGGVVVPGAGGLLAAGSCSVARKPSGVAILGPNLSTAEMATAR